MSRRSEQPPVPEKVEEMDTAHTGNDDPLQGRVEHLADRAIERVKQDVSLTEVSKKATEVAQTVRSVRSRPLILVLAIYLAAVVGGLVIAVSGGLSDWFMHVGMYLVIFAFLLLYLKAHMKRARVAKFLFGLVTVCLLAFFAWVLFDLRAPRQVVSDAGLVLRDALPGFGVIGVLLGMSGAGLIIHGLMPARQRVVEPDSHIGG